MMKQRICILMSAAMLLTAGAMPVYAEEPQSATMPVSVEYTEPQPELYGFSADVQEVGLGEGETYKLQVTLDETYYHTESLRFTSDRSSKASIDADGTITARETGTAVVRISAKLKEAFADGDPVRTITVKVTVTPDKSLTPEQAEALAALRRKGDRLFGEFQREEMVIRGKYPADAPRLDLETVESVLSDNYAELRQKLTALQPYPDFIGGSGVSLTEYWFDASGSEKIVLIEPQDSIFYVKCDTAGKVMEWRSFDPQQKELQTGAYLSMLAASYQVYNAVPETLMGDVNGDGTFDIMDLILFQKWLLAVPDTKLVDPSAADFCADGVLDVYDLCLMKMAVVGKSQSQTRKLTLETVRALSEKGDSLTWDDFRGFDGKDVGSGIDIYQYELENGYSLRVGGLLDRKPDFIMLCQGERSVDLRDGSDAVATFLEETCASDR